MMSVLDPEGKFERLWSPQAISQIGAVGRWAWAGVLAFVLGLGNGFLMGVEAGPIFEFRDQAVLRVEVSSPKMGPSLALMTRDNDLLEPWIVAEREGGGGSSMWLGSRLVVEVRDAEAWAHLILLPGMRLHREMNERIRIFEGEDARAVLEQVKVWQVEGVDCKVLCPVLKRSWEKMKSFAPRPNDPYFREQWYLENRNWESGEVLGPDLNVRSAWPVTQGQGVVIGISDDGFETTHPDLKDRSVGDLHYDFMRNLKPLGNPPVNGDHSTAVSGLAAASGDNGIGVSGVAPAAGLASLIIFDTNDFIADNEGLMDMFQHRNDAIAVQNHSWGNASLEQFPLSTLENLGVETAAIQGRGGKGVVMVRAGGNSRDASGNANDDGYLADPRAIAVAAIRGDGKAARYSNPGACLLVATPSGDTDFEENPCLTNQTNLITTDRTGSLGYNRGSFPSEPALADYAYGENGFDGTSAATPLATGVAALILSANPELSYRDVQQIFALSSRHPDPSLPGVRRNGAGFWVSHDIGFGVPDAGEAVRLAEKWPLRPAKKVVRVAADFFQSIPDLGLTVNVTGPGVPISLQGVLAMPSTGVHVEANTDSLPLVRVGRATQAITEDLTGKVALIQRGQNFFCEKIQVAADAGAALAIVYDNQGGNERMIMGGTDYVPIPAVFISQDEGELMALLLGEGVELSAQIRVNSFKETLTVGESILCEYVGLRVETNHNSRGDLRIALVSPKGTRSILQQVNFDGLPGPTSWTYFSTHHFFENAQGVWTVEILDEDEFGFGSVRRLQLEIHGVGMVDEDRDGLADDWEREFFKGLSAQPDGDEDGDGRWNAWEQAAGTNPTEVNDLFVVTRNPWNSELDRLSWPSLDGVEDTLLEQAALGGGGVIRQTLQGKFPEQERMVPRGAESNRFFWIERKPLR